MFLCIPGLSWDFCAYIANKVMALYLPCDRKCKYCRDRLIDDEKHFILVCEIFKIKLECFSNRLNVLNPNFGNMTYEQDQVVNSSGSKMVNFHRTKAGLT